MLVRHFAGSGAWARLEEYLHDGSMSLRDTLAAQARFVRGSVEEADALLARSTQIDPAFRSFAQRCRTQGASLTIVSSGIEPLIKRALARNGLGDLNVLANDVTIDEDGWTMQFRDSSSNGHDKAALVRAAVARGERVAYAGDGYSDYEAALAAQRRFAKKGRSLERYLRDRALPFTCFTSFSEVEAELFL